MDDNITPHKEKVKDTDKEDLLNYFNSNGINSRNLDSIKYKNSQIQCKLDSYISSIKSKNKNFFSSKNKKIFSFSLKNKKPKFFNEYLTNEIIKNLTKINVVKNERNKKNNYENNINKIKIKNIFLNSLNDDKSQNNSLESHNLVYRNKNENLLYLFDKTSRQFSDNFKSARNGYYNLIKRRNIYLKKFIFLKKNKSIQNYTEKKNIHILSKVISNIDKNENIKKNKINKSENFKKDFEKKTITAFLKRKKVNNLPVTFPLYLLNKNKYNSLSEKNRVEIILNKFICLKTHIVNDPSNASQIIKEFILENTNMSLEKLSEEKIKNFLDFLNIPFRFDPNRTIKEIIDEALDYKNKDNTKENQINPKLFMENNFNFNIINNRENNNFKIIKKLKKSYSSSNSFYFNDNKAKKLMNINNKTFDIKNKKLDTLIQDLENELNQIKENKIKKSNILKLKYINNKYITPKNKKIIEVDKNKNICLLNKNFSQRYEFLNSDNSNNKVKIKKKSLLKINDRMYYNNIKKNIFEEYDLDDITKNLKLTEYIFLQRARKALSLKKEKEKYSDIMNGIPKEH